MPFCYFDCFPFWFRGQVFGSNCYSTWPLLTFYSLYNGCPYVDLELFEAFQFWSNLLIVHIPGRDVRRAFTGPLMLRLLSCECGVSLNIIWLWMSFAVYHPVSLLHLHPESTVIR